MISKEEIYKKITPKNDIVFKKIFGSKGNEEILKSFLESILEIEIEYLTVDSGQELLPGFYDGKLSKLDVLARIQDGTWVNIEIQTNTQGYSDKRELAYWSKLYLEQFKQGEDYKKLDKAISIWIVDGEIYNFPKYHSKWKIGEEEFGRLEYFDDFEIHVIELKKFRKETIIKPKKKEFWLWFIDHTKKELVDMSSYSIEEIKKAKAEYEKMIADDPELRHFLMREEFAEWDRKAMLTDAKRQAREEGLAEGRAEGLAEGLAEGKAEAQKETAKKMLEKRIDIETISEITGLSKEEIEELKGL